MVEATPYPLPSVRVTLAQIEKKTGGSSHSGRQVDATNGVKSRSSCGDQGKDIIIAILCMSHGSQVSVATCL